MKTVRAIVVTNAPFLSQEFGNIFRDVHPEPLASVFVIVPYRAIPGPVMLNRNRFSICIDEPDELISKLEPLVVHRFWTDRKVRVVPSFFVDAILFGFSANT
jgi:hypothetical protein